MTKTAYQIILAGILLLNIKTFAQNFSCADLSKEIYSDSEIKKPNNTDNPALGYAKVNTVIQDVRYLNDFLGGNQCAKSNGCGDGSDKLQYQVYYPDITYTTPLPAIIFFHGGGFSDCTNFTNSDGMVTYCTQFAKRGFVAFNVEYRRGRIEDTAKKYTSASDVLALYRSVQDARGAIRTIVARELNKSTPYRIDVNNLFLSGASSGSVIALDIGFLTPNMAYQIFPNVRSHLGAIDTDNYAGNAAPTSYRIRGVLNLWGGISVPENYANDPEDFLSQNTSLPVFIGFHGGSDNVVKIASDNMYYSTGSTYAMESSCVLGGTYTLPNNGAKNADLKTFGSQGIYDMLTTTFKIPCELYIDCDMKHGLDEATSDFGLANGDASAVTDKQVQKYIVQRAATFFQYVMNTNFPYTLTHTKFVDCLNTRYGCSSDVNTTCDNNAVCTRALKSSASSEENIITKKQSDILFTMAQANKTIYINLYKAGNAKIVLFNLNGAPVKTVQSNDRQNTLDCNNFSAGLYLLRVMQGNDIQTAKIILQ